MHAIEHDLLVLTDEVYEHLVFGGARHVSIATLPGMRERTLVVSSAGKTFNVTGWKIGWICGPAPLVTAVRTAKQFLTYVNGGPFQPAVAAGLAMPDDATSRRRPATWSTGATSWSRVCASGGLPVITPEATYFATVDVRSVQPDGDGLAFCRVAARSGPASSPSRPACSTTPRTPTSVGTWSASPSASATRCWRRPCERLRRLT